MGRLLAPGAAGPVSDDVRLYRRLRADPQFRPLLEMYALAGTLSRLSLDDLEALARRHGAESLGGISDDLFREAGQYEIGHAVGFADRVRDYVRDAVARAKHAGARSASAARGVIAADRVASVACGLPHPVSRARPTLLVGDAAAVRALIDRVAAAALVTPEAPAVFHFWCSLGSRAPGLDPEAWRDDLYSARRLTPAGTDLLLVDNVLHGVRVKQSGRVRSRFDRGTMAIRRLSTMARNHRVAIVAGYYWDASVDKDDAHYRAMKEWADAYRVERAGPNLVVCDQAGETATFPFRLPRGAAA